MMATTIEIPKTTLPSAPAPSRDVRRLEMRVRELEQRLRSHQGAMVVALTHILGLKELGARRHGARLAEWAVELAHALGSGDDVIGSVETAALLHDVGKTSIPDHILHKPGPLTETEMAEMRRHPEYGWAILRLFPELRHAALIVLHHHERIDGRGYPAGLAGDEIPLGARIVSVVDAFDAMISKRAYREGLPFEEAVRRLRAGSGTQFDPDVVETFARIAQRELRSSAGEDSPYARVRARSQPSARREPEGSGLPLWSAR